MGEACSTHGRYTCNIQYARRKSLKGDITCDAWMNEVTILKWFLKEHNARVLSAFNWTSKGHVPMTGSREHNDEALRFGNAVESLGFLYDCHILKKEPVPHNMSVCYLQGGCW
jgi:hypothetical protein